MKGGKLSWREEDVVVRLEEGIPRQSPQLQLGLWALVLLGLISWGREACTGACTALLCLPRSSRS